MDMETEWTIFKASSADAASRSSNQNTVGPCHISNRRSPAMISAVELKKCFGVWLSQRTHEAADRYRMVNRAKTTVIGEARTQSWEEFGRRFSWLLEGSDKSFGDLEKESGPCHTILKQYFSGLFMINGRFHLLIDQGFVCSNEGVVLIYHVKEGAKSTAFNLLVHQYFTYNHEIWIVIKRTYWIQTAIITFLCTLVGPSLSDKMRSSIIWQVMDFVILCD